MSFTGRGESSARQRHDMSPCSSAEVRDAAAEGAAGRQPVERHLIGPQARKLHQLRLGAERILLAGPDRQPAVGELRGDVDRLHRARDAATACGSWPRPALPGALRQASLRRRREKLLALAALQRPVLRAIMRRGVADRRAAVVELRLERVERLVRPPPAFGDHGDRVVGLPPFDAGHTHRWRSVDRDQPAAMHGRRATAACSMSGS